MVRCGNCKEDHRTTADVRECYTNAGKIKVQQDSAITETVWPPSEKQVQYVLGLQVERNLPDGYIAHTDDELRKMDRDRVSDIIVFLRELSRKEGKSGGNYSMPAGRYAVEFRDDNVWRFYEVNKPTEGRWEGYTFIKMLVGAPGDYQKVDMNPQHRHHILSIIESNQKQAMLDYGLQSGVCGRCHSPLTDPQSLARGIGPKCATMSGWF